MSATPSIFRVNPRMRIVPLSNDEYSMCWYGAPTCTVKEGELDGGALALLLMFSEPRGLDDVRREFVSQQPVSREEIDAVLTELVLEEYIVPAGSEAPGQGEGLAARHRVILAAGAENATLPTNVPCPVGCRFCYEKKVRKLFPRTVIDAIPAYTEQSFEYFFERASKKKTCLKQHSVWLVDDGQGHYGFNCDLFSLGLTEGQIERLLEHNERVMSELPAWDSSRVPYLYTTGYELDPAVARRLSQRHPAVFRLWLSVISFDDDLRRQVFRNPFPASRLAPIIDEVAGLALFLIHVDPERTLADLVRIDELARQDLQVIILDLHFTRHHPAAIRALGARSTESMEELVARLAGEPSLLEHLPLENITFHGPSRAIAWKLRGALARLFDPFTLAAGDVALCSRAAHGAITSAVGDRVKVIAAEDSYGGNTDFATSLTSADVIRRIEELRGRGEEIRRVFLPNSIWPVRGHDLRGDTAETVRRAFPGMAVVDLDIPVDLLDQTLSLADCVSYFAARSAGQVGAPLPEAERAAAPGPIRATASLGKNERRWRRGALREVLAPFCPGPADVLVCRSVVAEHLREVVKEGTGLCPVGALRDEAPWDMTVSAEEVIEQIEERSRREPALERVILFCVVDEEGNADLGERAARAVQAAFPRVKVVVLEIPQSIMWPGLPG